MEVCYEIYSNKTGEIVIRSIECFHSIEEFYEIMTNKGYVTSKYTYQISASNK